MRRLLFLSWASLLLHAAHGQINSQRPLINDIKVQNIGSLPFVNSQGLDELQRMRLTRGFEDAMKMAHDALVSISKPPNGFPHMFEKYFASGDKTKVEVIFKSIIGSGSDPYLGNDRLENVHFTDADLNGLCDPITDPKPGTILMYTYNELVDKTKPSFIVVCPILWTLDIPNAKDIKCDEICTKDSCTLSYRMRSIGELVLHELIHRTSIINPKPSWLRKDEVIIDGQMKKPDGSIVYLYDTYYTQELIRTKNNHEIAKALTNADSYAMFAREAYFRTYCPGMPFPDPKSYEPDPRVQHPRKAGVPSASEL